MKHIFLNAAEKTLLEFGKPMNVKDLIQKAFDLGFLVSRGKTPLNSMRARLSEDIRKKGDSSLFMRVGPNKFGLRKWNRKEYIGKPFIKGIPERVVCIPSKFINETNPFLGFHRGYKAYLNIIKNPNNLIIIDRSEANKRDDLKQLVSYVIIKNSNGEVLTYRRGVYSTVDNFLKGVLCLGFGGHVIEKDFYNLFGIKDAGICNSATREISEEIKDLYISDLNYLGVINDDSTSLGLKHFCFVLEPIYPIDIDVKKYKTEMSINKLEYMSVSQLWNNFHELEFWSQITCKSLFSKPANYKPVVIKSKSISNLRGPIFIVGEIGSGKTEVSNYLSKKLNLPLLSTRDCVAELIGMDNFGNNSRNVFQKRALDLVNNPEGIYLLSNKIAEKVKGYASRIIIDGVRNIETYKLLKKMFPDLVLIFVEVPKDFAYTLYWRRRGKKVPISEFRSEREHEVEKEVSLFKTYSHVTIFNGGNLSDLYNELKKWGTILNEI